MAEPRLKPCPICGCATPVYLEAVLPHETGYVYCNECCAGGPKPRLPDWAGSAVAKKLACNAWNQRSQWAIDVGLRAEQATLTLSPCPFCGCRSPEEKTLAALEIYGCCWQTCWAECPDCGAESSTIELTDKPDGPANPQMVRDAWNLRASPLTGASQVLSAPI